jgi:hypothetical protein
MAEREVVRAAASGNVWCSASHPEHVRPMLQVCVYGCSVRALAVRERRPSDPDIMVLYMQLACMLACCLFRRRLQMNKRT